VLSAARQTTTAAMKIAVATERRPRYRARRTLSRPSPVGAESARAARGTAGVIGTAGSKGSLCGEFGTAVN